MEEKSLKITGANTKFFNKITKTLTKMLIPTKIGINGMLISMKRNNIIKAYENYIKNMDGKNKEDYEKKYEDSYSAYLDSLDKYVLDSIYKKVKNNTATEFEKDALSRYYEVTSLKEREYNEYKYRKQKYLLELDKESIDVSGKGKVKQKYYKFYIDKMDNLYKAILKNYSIKLADSTNIYDTSKEWIYVKIFATLEEYVHNIFAIKLEIDGQEKYKDIYDEYEKFEAYTIGKLDTKDNIEKNTILMGISRKIFTHSIPLVVAEQCYEKLLNDARTLVQDTKITTKREKAYEMLINLIEEYNEKLLSTKVYWDDMNARDKYKKFWDKYKEISKLKDTDSMEYMRQKEVLFIKDDIKKIENSKIDYSKIIIYYKRKLVDYDALRQIKNKYTSEGKYKGVIIKENKVVA